MMYIIIIVLLLIFLLMTIYLLKNYIFLRYFLRGPIVFKLPFASAQPIIDAIITHSPEYVRVALFPFVFVLLVDPEAIGEAINTLPKDEIVTSAYDSWFRSGLFVYKSPDKLWKQARSNLNHGFNSKAIQQYINIQNTKTVDLISICNEEVQKSGYIDISKYIQMYIFDIYINCMFNESISILANRDEKATKFLNASNRIIQLILKKYGNPLYVLSNFIYKKSKDGKEFLECCKSTQEYLRTMIQLRRKNNSNEVDKSKKYQDFLEFLIQIRTDEVNSASDGSDEDIVNDLNNFIFGALDTTSSFCLSVLYCLTQYPEMQQKCRDEINRVLGDKVHLDNEDIKQLNYVAMFIKESGRMYTPIFQISRKTEKRQKIGSQYLPVNTKVPICLQGVHLNPSVWKDPLTFDPERFSDEKFNQMPKYSFLPFFGGLRSCIGTQMSMNTLIIFVSEFVMTFDISLKSGYIYAKSYPGVLLPQDGLPLVLRKL